MATKMTQVLTALVFMAVLVTAARAQSDEYPLTAEITSSAAHVRTDSTIGAESICLLNRKHRVEIVGQAYDWFKIKLPSSAPAYVNQQFVEINPEENDSGEISGDNVNIRLKPDLSGSILGQVQSGYKIRILGKSGNWFRIRPPDDATGWVHKNMVGKPLTAAQSRTRRVTPQKDESARNAPSAPVKEDVQEMIVVEGTIKPKVFTSVASHKIVSSDGEVFLLRSGTVDLKLFLGRPVRVTGMPAPGPRNLLNVQKVEEIVKQSVDSGNTAGQAESQAQASAANERDQAPDAVAGDQQ